MKMEAGSIERLFSLYQHKRMIFRKSMGKADIEWIENTYSCKGQVVLGIYMNKTMQAKINPLDAVVITDAGITYGQPEVTEIRFIRWRDLLELMTDGKPHPILGWITLSNKELIHFTDNADAMFVFLRKMAEEITGNDISAEIHSLESSLSDKDIGLYNTQEIEKRREKDTKDFEKLSIGFGFVKRNWLLIIILFYVVPGIIAIIVR